MNLSNIKNSITSLPGKITKKHLFLAVAVVILLELIWAYRSTNLFSIFNKSTPTGKTNISVGSKTVKQPDGKLALTSSKKELKIGEIVPVAINIDANKKTDGTDLIINYDPNLLTVMANETKAPVQVGAIYTDYPVNKYDEKTGLITVSGVSNSGDGIVPKGVFGTILFKAKASGNAKISFDFSKGSTTDTNIIETKSANDILEEVSNLELNITP